MNANEVERQAAYEMAKIRERKYPPEKACQLLDRLMLWVMQEHPDGLAAKAAERD
jgi:hypothetical protein